MRGASGCGGGADSGGETPFEQRTDFVTAMEAGGVAAMEVVARDLKALGLYQARALSYDGVEVEPLEHPLTPEQRRIYDAYVRPHDLRHTYASIALMHGETVLTIGRLLGHDHPGTTLKYTNFADAAAREAVDAVSSVLRRA